jgi:hypothetical protein
MSESATQPSGQILTAPSSALPENRSESLPSEEVQSLPEMTTTTMKQFVIDLDKDEYDRFREVTQYFKNDLLDLYNSNIMDLDDTVREVFQYGYFVFEDLYPLMYLEVMGIADVLDIEPWIVFYHNYYYLTKSFCTSLITSLPDGDIIL